MRLVPPRRQCLSIVVPVYRGERYLEQLVAELASLRGMLLRERSPVEVDRAIFVDDAAVDGSGPLLDRLAAQHAWIEVLHLPRNAGQHVATAAGLARAPGDWIATLDEDLQHRPESLLPLLAAAAAASADLVYAAPHGGVHRTFYRDASSLTAKFLIGLLSGNRNVRHFNSFRVVRGPIARAAATEITAGTYLDIALSWFAERVVVVPLSLVDRRDLAGLPGGYDLPGLLRHAKRMLLTSWKGPPRRAGLRSGTGAEVERPPYPDGREREIAVDRTRDIEVSDFLLRLGSNSRGPGEPAC